MILKINSNRGHTGSLLVNIMAPPAATIALCHCGDNLPYPIFI